MGGVIAGALVAALLLPAAIGIAKALRDSLRDITEHRRRAKMERCIKLAPRIGRDPD